MTQLAVLESGATVTIDDDPLGRGGMGTVYATTDGQFVVKLFHQPSAELAAAMRQVLGKCNCTRDVTFPAREAYWNALYVWPTALVVAPSLGLLIPRFPREMLSLIWLFGPRNYASLPPAAKQWNTRVLLAWRLTQAIARMHLMGLAHSDLSPNNVLANPATGQLRIIDMDGLVVQDFVPPQVDGTPRYIAPEVLARRGSAGIATDKHALAVLVYQLLLGRHPLLGPFDFGLDPFDPDAIEARQLGEDGLYIEHPKDARNRPSKLYPAALLGDSLKRLFEQAFVAGLRDPAARPSAQQWRTALGRLSDRLVTCSNPACVDRYYPVRDGQPSRCPWCATPLAITGGIPALRLYSPAFHLETDYWIAGYPGKVLHHWHRENGGEPDPFADQTPIARLERTGEQWSLINLACPGLAEMSPQGQPLRTVAVGQSIQLADRQVLRLGPSPSSRFVLVQWIR